MGIRTLGIVFAVAILLLFTGTAVRADNVDFMCGLGSSSACSGSIQQSGGDISTTGITVYNDSGPYTATVPFTLTFDVVAGTLSIVGTGAYSGEDLIGQITSSSSSAGATTTDVSFVAVWPTLPTSVQSLLGSATGEDSGFVIAMTNTGAAQSVDVVITPDPVPAPEPASLTLLGVGLAAFAGIRRRKLA
jgi:hypothetical protein